MKSSEKVQEEKKDALAEKKAEKEKNKEEQAKQKQENEGEDSPFGGMKGSENFRRNMGCGG